MAKNRRLAAAAGAISLAGVFVAGPVSAQGTGEAYLGSASGRALNIQLLGVGATVGVSTAKVTSALTSVAEGTGLVGTAGTNARVDLSGSGSDSKPNACAVGLPVADILNVGLACGSASGSLDGNNPVANSEGKVAGIDLDISSVLGLAGLDTTLTTLVNETVLGTAKSTVAGLPLGLGDTLTPVVETVQGTVNDLLNTKTLALTAGKSTSSVVTDAGKVTSSATASGAEVQILPERELAGVKVPALATITVSSASATAVYDRATGTSTPTFDPSLVTVKLGPTALLPSGTEVKVPVGASQTILAGTPLESDIIVAAGRTVTNPDGTVGAIADGVKLHLLKGVNNGILVELAHAEAGVGGTPAAAALELPKNQELPRTGGTPWIPLAGVSILGLAVLVRRVLVRAY